MAEGVIGSVGVSVVPDAEDFWRRFVDQTRPGAVRAGADLGTDVRRGMQAELDRGVDVRVRADTGTARADIASVGSAANEAGADIRGNLIKAAIAISPALIPITAVGVPALATLALGAKKAGQEIKTGLTDEFHNLQRVAGRALTPGVESMIHMLQQAEPQLRQIVNLFGHAFSDELTKLSNSLANGGLQSFLSYAEQELPIVEDTFNNILGTAGHLIVVLQPVGDELLKDVDHAVKFADELTQIVGEAEKAAKAVGSIKVPGAGDLNLGGVFGKANDLYKKYIDPIGRLETGIGYLSKGISGLSDSLFGAAAPEGAITRSADEASRAIYHEVAALKALDQQVAKDLSAKVAQAQAQNAFISSAHSLADAIAVNGATLSASTEKGLANRDALINAAGAALQFYNAQIQAGVGARQAAANLAGDVKQLELTAIHGGLAKGKVDALLRSMNLLPRKITTEFDVDISPAIQALQAVTSVIGLIPGLGILAAPLQVAIAAAGAVGSHLPDKKGNVLGQGIVPPKGVIPGGGAVSPDPSVLDKLKQAATPDPIFTKLVDELRQARQQRAQEIQTIQSAVTGTFDITTVGQNSLGEPVTLFDIQSGLKTALRNAKQFEHVLKRLAREGLNDSLLAQLAEAGPNALPQAQALLSATPKQLAQINREYRQLGQTGHALGKFVGNDLYQAGIQAADGLVRGLRSKKSDLTDTMKDLARSMIRELRRELNMHSPSRRLFDEGALAFEGFRLGIASKAADVASAAGLVAGNSIPNRPSYKFDGMTRAGGGTLVAGDFVNHQHFDRPVPEPPSRSQGAAMRAARNSLGG